MSAASPRKGSPLGLVAKGVVALLISVAAFWWAFHDVEMDDISERLRQTSPTIVVLFFLSQVGNHLLRTWRWSLLIRPLGPATPRAIFAASSIGFPATFFLPLRLGEFVRPAMIRRSGVPFAGAMASVVVERVADGLFNLGLFFALLSAMPASAPVPDDLRTYAMIALVLFGGAFIVLILTVIMQRPAFALIERLLKPVAPGLSDRVLGLLGAFIDGLKALKTPGQLALFIALTCAFWLINGFATWYLATTYIPDLPVWAGPFATSVVIFAIMIPAGPAFAGTLEAGFKFGLAPYGVAAGPSAALALANHAILLTTMALLAGVGFMAAEPGQVAKASKADADPAPEATAGAKAAAASPNPHPEAAPDPAATTGERDPVSETTAS